MDAQIAEILKIVIALIAIFLLVMVHDLPS
jgi:hypothetical protein